MIINLNGSGILIFLWEFSKFSGLYFSHYQGLNERGGLKPKELRIAIAKRYVRFLKNLKERKETEKVNVNENRIKYNILLSSIIPN